jgi:ATP-dependent Lhr-like helicase
MQLANKWFRHKGWKPHKFQKETWAAIGAGNSGLLNAPTGYGKTMAIWFGVLQQYYDQPKPAAGLHCLWITPLRALSKEIVLATQQVSSDLDLNYRIGLRSGDTSTAERNRQNKKMPQALVTTPESVHILLATKEYEKLFRNLAFVIVDEWHELLGSKRGVQIELALSRLKAINPSLRIWGISATIGNLTQAKDILLAGSRDTSLIIRADIKKKLVIKTLFPDTVENYSWAGHLGLTMLPKVLPVLKESKSVLIFTNTRAHAEKWYRQLLETEPSLAGQIALHHGSLGDSTRKWVEDNLHAGRLKAVVCTSSLDLGVDFRPVDTVVQVGSPKGVARFMQRAGRSGHAPGETSIIYFLPTNSLEIIEGSAIRTAIDHKQMEQRIPYIRSFDVLIQYLVTLAVSDGFRAEQIYAEIKATHCYASVTREEFEWCLDFITKGGKSLGSYDEYHKVVQEEGIFRVKDRTIATRHRLGIGTIVSDSMMQVKFRSGKRLGVMEENFLSRLRPGDVFWYSGRNLELLQIHNMEAIVKPSKAEKGTIPSWMGGRMPLSAELSQNIRLQLDEYTQSIFKLPELKKLKPLLDLQQKVSAVPRINELLIEQLKTREGYHLFIFPFEGRSLHEGIATVLAYRISLLLPVTFSIAMNDYGFELLSDQEIDVRAIIDNDLFSPEHLYDDTLKTNNAAEMARRRFREIASIAGLVFSGFPGKQKKTRHLQASSQLFFEVFSDYEKDNLLLRQAFDEVLDFQLEVARLQEAFRRISTNKIILSRPEKPTPFSFPLLVDMFRERFSSEDLQARIDKILDSIAAQNKK